MSTHNDSEFQFATVAIALAYKFNNDYQKVLEKYEPELQLVIATHLEKLFALYKESPEDCYKQIHDAEMTLFEKYGLAMKPYNDMQFYEYFQPDTVLVQKGILSAEKWNSLPGDKQQVSPEEMDKFIHAALYGITLSRKYMLLDRNVQELSKENEQYKKEAGKNEQTRARQLLAIYFLLKSQDIEHGTATSASAVARLIHLISNTPLTNIQNSDIYKKYREMPNYKKKKELLADLKYIRPFFEDTAFTSVVSLIDTEIKKLEK